MNKRFSVKNIILTLAVMVLPIMVFSFSALNTYNAAEITAVSDTDVVFDDNENVTIIFDTETTYSQAELEKSSQYIRFTSLEKGTSYNNFVTGNDVRDINGSTTHVEKTFKSTAFGYNQNWVAETSIDTYDNGSVITKPVTQIITVPDDFYKELELSNSQKVVAYAGENNQLTISRTPIEVKVNSVDGTKTQIQDDGSVDVTVELEGEYLDQITNAQLSLNSGNKSYLANASIISQSKDKMTITNTYTQDDLTPVDTMYNLNYRLLVGSSIKADAGVISSTAKADEVKVGSKITVLNANENDQLSLGIKQAPVSITSVDAKESNVLSNGDIEFNITITGESLNTLSSNDLTLMLNAFNVSGTSIVSQSESQLVITNTVSSDILDSNVDYITQLKIGSNIIKPIVSSEELKLEQKVGDSTSYINASKDGQVHVGRNVLKNIKVIDVDGKDSEVLADGSIRIRTTITGENLDLVNNVKLVANQYSNSVTIESQSESKIVISKNFGPTAFKNDIGVDFNATIKLYNSENEVVSEDIVKSSQAIDSKKSLGSTESYVNAQAEEVLVFGVRQASEPEVAENGIDAKNSSVDSEGNTTILVEVTGSNLDNVTKATLTANQYQNPTKIVSQSEAKLVVSKTFSITALHNGIDFTSTLKLYDVSGAYKEYDVTSSTKLDYNIVVDSKVVYLTSEENGLIHYGQKDYVPATPIVDKDGIDGKDSVVNPDGTVTINATISGENLNNVNSVTYYVNSRYRNPMEIVSQSDTQIKTRKTFSLTDLKNGVDFSGDILLDTTNVGALVSSTEQNQKVTTAAEITTLTSKANEQIHFIRSEFTDIHFNGQEVIPTYEMNEEISVDQLVSDAVLLITGGNGTFTYSGDVDTSIVGNRTTQVQVSDGVNTLEISVAYVVVETPTETGSIININATQTNAQVIYSYNDAQLGVEGTLELVKGSSVISSVVVENTAYATFDFSALTPNTQYSVILRDSNGDELSRRIFTTLEEEKEESSGTINKLTPTTNSVLINYTYKDSDNVANGQIISVYFGTDTSVTPIASQTINAGTLINLNISGLDEDTLYTVVISDSTGVKDSDSFITDKNIIDSSGTINNVTVTEDSATINYSYSDVDNVAENQRLSVYDLDGNLVQEIVINEGNNINQNFNGLKPNTSYNLLLRDNTGTKDTYSFTTKQEIIDSSGAINSTTLINTEVRINFTYNDPSNVATGQRITVYAEGQTSGSYIQELAVSEGSNLNILTDSLEQGKTYNIVLQDSTGIKDTTNVTIPSLSTGTIIGEEASNQIKATYSYNTTGANKNAKVAVYEGSDVTSGTPVAIIDAQSGNDIDYIFEELKNDTTYTVVLYDDYGIVDSDVVTTLYYVGAHAQKSNQYYLVHNNVIDLQECPNNLVYDEYYLIPIKDEGMYTFKVNGSTINGNASDYGTFIAKKAYDNLLNYGFNVLGNSYRSFGNSMCNDTDKSMDLDEKLISEGYSGAVVLETFDNNGQLHTREYYTVDSSNVKEPSTGSITNVNTTTDTASITYVYVDDDDYATDEKLSIYLGNSTSGTPVKSVNITELSTSIIIDGLAPGTQYTAVLSDSKNSNISEYSFTTKEDTETSSTGQILNVVPGINNANITYNYTDNDGYATNEKVSVYLGNTTSGTPVKTATASSGTNSVNITGLNPNTLYTVVLGDSKNAIISSYSFTTLKTTQPSSGEITYGETSANSVILAYSYIDTDNYATGEKISLYAGSNTSGTPLQTKTISGSLHSVTFSGLTQNTSYTAVLSDSRNSNLDSYSFTTLKTIQPSYGVITYGDVKSNSVVLTYAYIDNDNYASNEKISLYLGSTTSGTPVQSKAVTQTASSIEFTGLTPNTRYTAVLGDSKDANLGSYSFTTLADTKKESNGQISNVATTTNSADITYDYTDTDNVASNEKINIYQGSNVTTGNVYKTVNITTGTSKKVTVSGFPESSTDKYYTAVLVDSTGNKDTYTFKLTNSVPVPTPSGDEGVIPSGSSNQLYIRDNGRLIPHTCPGILDFETEYFVAMIPNGGNAVSGTYSVYVEGNFIMYNLQNPFISKIAGDSLKSQGYSDYEISTQAVLFTKHGQCGQQNTIAINRIDKNGDGVVTVAVKQGNTVISSQNFTPIN